MSVRAQDAISAAGFTMGEETITDEWIAVACDDCMDHRLLSDCQVATERIEGEAGDYEQTEYMCLCGSVLMVVGPTSEFASGFVFGEWVLNPSSRMSITPPVH